MSYGKLSTLSEISPPMSGGPREPMLPMSIAGRRRRDTARQEVVSEHVGDASAPRGLLIYRA